MTEYKLVCPVCGSDWIEVIDQVDYDAYAYRCLDCGWMGDDDSIKYKKVNRK